MTGADLTIRNAWVVTEEGVIDGGVACDDGTIVHVGADTSLPEGTREIDANGTFLLPGLVDPHVHLGRRDAGFPDQLPIDFETETRGALHGGVTTVMNFI